MVSSPFVAAIPENERMRSKGSGDENEFMPLPFDDDLPPDEDTESCDGQRDDYHLVAGIRFLSW